MGSYELAMTLLIEMFHFVISEKPYLSYLMVFFPVTKVGFFFNQLSTVCSCFFKCFNYVEAVLSS